MSRRSRILSFGAAGLLVGAGAGMAAALSGSVGQVAGLVLVGLGLILATGLGFLEVGLSEDRERGEMDRRARAARAERAERKTANEGHLAGIRGSSTRPRLGRRRGSRRRLG